MDVPADPASPATVATSATGSAEASSAAATFPAEPWRAVNFSLLLPGLGHWDLGERGRGLGWMLAALASWSLGVAFLVLPGWNAALGLILLFASIAVVVLAALDAYRIAARRNGPLEDVRKQQRDAWKIAFFDRMLPGLGHFYGRRTPSGIAWLVLWVVVNAVASPLRGLAAGAALALAVFDGWRRGKARRAGDAGLAIVFAMAVAIWTAVSLVVPDIVRERYLRAFRLPSGSMQPTLRTGDFVFVDLRPFEPRRGDLVVHSMPSRPADRFVKRVLGVGGDIVEFRADGAYCNGALAVRAPIPHAMLEQDDYFGHPGAPYRVPEGALFVVGDDLANSNDSRFFGPIQARALFGRPYKIYWPPQRARTL